MTRADILEKIDRAFASPRPAQMLRDPDHCCECVEHEQTMQALTPETVTLAAVGNPGWDPVCYLSDAAFCYFMPGLARLALDGRGEDNYIDQLLFHLDYGRVFILDAAQKAAVSALLDHILETMAEEVWDDAQLGRVMDKLQMEGPPPLEHYLTP